MQITNKIHFRNLRGDLFGGLTTALVSLPLALAFGVASGAGAVAGLYGAVCVGFFAALFGGIPTLLSKLIEAITVSPVYRLSCNTCVVVPRSYSL
nr:SulP family inorganic anion transporter [Chroococcidiopsis sp. [FACHB-1243]]